MATISVNINTGDEIEIPFAGAGSATPSAAARFISGIDWQIDSRPPVSVIPPNAVGGAGATVPFSFQIMDADCPSEGVWYMLTVYVWEDDGNLTINSFTFQRKPDQFIDITAMMNMP